MLHFNNKLLFLLLLLSGTSLTATNDKDDTSDKEGSPDEHISDIAQEAYGKLLGFAALKTFEHSLATEKLAIAEVLKLYIKENLDTFEFVQETIAQCAVSPFIKCKVTKPRQINKDSQGQSKDEEEDSYKYNFLNPDSLPKTLFYSIPATVLREGILNGLTKFLHVTAKKVGIKHPPLIEKNKKLYQSGKLIAKSIARHMLDEFIIKKWKPFE